MYYRTLRGVGVIAAGFMALLLTGCDSPVFELQVVNAGDYTLTSVRLVKYEEDPAEQAQAFEEAENLLPKDTTNTTIPLASGETVTTPHIMRADKYFVALTFFVHGAYIEHIEEAPVDFTGLPDAALVVMTVKRQRPDAKSEPEVEISFVYY